MTSNTMQVKIKIAVIISALLFSLALSNAVLAESTGSSGGGSQQLLTGETANKLKTQDNAFLAAAGLGTNVSLGQVVSYVIKFVLSLLGIIFVILIIYAGFMWMTAAGNEEKITQAKKTMASATIGLAIVLAAYAITYFVIDQLLIATQGSERGLE